jgi:hypothetical protein
MGKYFGLQEAHRLCEKSSSEGGAQAVIVAQDWQH